MKNRILLLSIGLLCFLLFMMVKLPASIVYQLAGLEKQGVQMRQLSGSAWSGQAGSIKMLGQTFQNVHWTLNPLTLLLGEMALNVDIKDVEYPLKGDINLAFNGDIEAQELTGKLPAALLNQIPMLAFIQLSGNLSIDMKSLSYIDKELQEAQGKILLAQGFLQQPVQTELGNIKMNLDTRPGEITVEIKDQQAPIGIDGLLRLNPGHKFSFKALFSPTVKADNFIISMLKNAGKLHSDGSMTIQYEGVY